MFNTARPILIDSENEAVELAELASVIYHDIFDFPLNIREIVKWRAGEKVVVNVNHSVLVFRNGYYYLYGNETSVLKRKMRERISKKKMKIAEKAALVLNFSPTVRMVAVTGALAMGNAGDNSDIDLLIVTKKNTLWATRGFALLVFKILRFPMRRYKDKDQKDKLCLNMWLDEESLCWNKKNRNIFTAHEVAQVTPLVNKGSTYEKFIGKNVWIGEYWPNAVRIKRKKKEKPGLIYNVLNWLFSLPFKIFEPIAQKVQYLYMKDKITREVVEPKRALFHPIDWSKHVHIRLQDKLSFG